MSSNQNLEAFIGSGTCRHRLTGQLPSLTGGHLVLQGEAFICFIGLFRTKLEAFIGTGDLDLQRVARRHDGEVREGVSDHQIIFKSRLNHFELNYF